MQAAILRPTIYEVHRRKDGSVSYMDVVVQTISEDLGLTRYYLVKINFPDSTVGVDNVSYRAGEDQYTQATTSVAAIAGDDYTVYEVPKGVNQSVDMLTSYKTNHMSKPADSVNFGKNDSGVGAESFFMIEYCQEEDTSQGFTDLGFAKLGTDGKYSLTSNCANFSISCPTNTSIDMYMEAGAKMGYYRITPVYARTEYFYLYSEAQAFLESMNAGVDSKYQGSIEKKTSDRGYTIYKAVMYMAYEPTIIHKRANDDSYLKNIYMTDEAGTRNLSSIDADITWDSVGTDSDLAKLDESLVSSYDRGKLTAHEGESKKTNQVRYKDGLITYNADPLNDSNNNSKEDVHAFTVYAYISTNVRNSAGEQESVNEAYLDMQYSYLPGNSTLYYLKDATYNQESGAYESGGSWAEVRFESDTSDDAQKTVVEEDKKYFKYSNFTADNVDKETKIFKVVAENGYVSYYTIYALQNKRNKTVEVLVGDYTKDTSSGTLKEEDKGTQALLKDIVDKYGTFSVTMQLMRDGEAVTKQTGYYQETTGDITNSSTTGTSASSGSSGNVYCNLKFGSYDILFNVPESAGYKYTLYYYGTGDTPIPLEESPDNPNAYRLPLRFANQTSAGSSIKICVSISKAKDVPWGRVEEALTQGALTQGASTQGASQ
jgi:hypothetical protein